MKGIYTLCVLISLAALVSACGPAAGVATPSGFVSLSEDHLGRDESYRAVSADGAVVVVRSHENESFGTVEFWVEALVRELVETSGYEVLEQEPVSPRSGPSGTMVRVRGALDDQIHHYDIALFVVGDEVVTVEMAAPEAVYEDRRRDFSTVLASLELE